MHQSGNVLERTIGTFIGLAIKGTIAFLSCIFFADYKMVEKRAREKAKNAASAGPFTTPGGALMLKPPTVIPTLCDELERAFYKRYRGFLTIFVVFAGGIIIYDLSRGIGLKLADYVIAALLVAFCTWIIKKALGHVYDARIGILKAGAEGEAQLAKYLGQLPKGYTILCDIEVPKKDGNTSQVDAMVFGPTGVFVIEAKNIDGVIQGHEQENCWVRHKQSNSGQWYQEKINNPVKQNASHIYTIKEFMKKEAGYAVWFNSIVVFVGNTLLNVQGEKVPILHINSLVNYIRNFNGWITKKDLQSAISTFERLI